MKKNRAFEPSVDLSVYFVADPQACAGRLLEDIVRAAAKGGVTMVQLRNKVDTHAKILSQARDLQSVLKPFNIPLIINDHVDIAHEINADGVHIGQGDITPHAAREILGEDKIIGLTAFTEDHFKNLDPSIIDYVGTGPFYETLTKPGKKVLGAENFASLVKKSPVPVVGIGGVTPGNTAAVIHAGAQGVAMMRAISEAQDPAAAAREFIKAVQTAKMERAA